MKLAIAAVLMMLATPVMAVEVIGSVGQSEDKATGKTNTEYVARVQDSNLGLSVTAGAIDRIEADLTIQPVKTAQWFSVTAGVGAVTGDMPGHWTYAIEPKVTYALNDKLSVDGSFKYRDSLKPSESDMSQTWGGGVTYAVGKNLSLGLRYEDATGDQNTKTTYASLGYKF